MEAIAVVGFASSLPGDPATGEDFWKLLCDGRSTETPIPKDRFNIDAFYHPDQDRIDTVSAGLVSYTKCEILRLTKSQINVRTGHFLSGDITAFDAPFFSIQPTEVASMDPQQRITLETSYRALENGESPILLLQKVD